MIKPICIVFIAIFDLAWGSKRLCPGGDEPFTRVNTTNRLIWLRSQMMQAASGRGPVVDTYIVTSDDEHQSEYPAERDKRLKYISGYSGPGVGVISTITTSSQPLTLFVPSDYFNRADQEVSCDWVIKNLEDVNAPSIVQVLKKGTKLSYRVGADPKLIPYPTWNRWMRDLEKERIALVEVSNNLVDLTWTIGRPEYSQHSAFIFPVEYAGETWQNKVSLLRSQMAGPDRLRPECDAIIVTALDEIAWLLNVRGRDVPFGPFVRSYLIITMEEIHWYVPKEKITDPVKRQLKIDSYGPFNVRVHPYETVWSDIRTTSQRWRKALIPGASVFSRGASQAVYSAVPPEKRLVRESPVVLLKASKNPKEVEGMRRASLRDSVAVVEFLADTDKKIKDGSNLTETMMTKTMEMFRLKQNLTQGVPYPSVVAFGPHGALPHFEPQNATDITIRSNSTVVVKGGHHYYDGTTSVSRTLHFGIPTRSQIEAYTRLLAALIQFSTLTIPRTTRMSDADLIVRSSLWREGMSYNHPSGYGVGAFSSVKESPILIDYNSNSKETFKEGYFLTLEPSYSKIGEYGVRLGNMLEVVNATESNSDGRRLNFNVTSLVPFERKMMDPSLLSRLEMEWINAYHLRVLQQVGSELKRKGNLEALYWLEDQTERLTESSAAVNIVFQPQHFAVAVFVALRILL